MSRIAIIHGPNLNMLGTREPEIYGTLTLEELNRRIEKLAGENHEVQAFQSNSEGAIIGKLHELRFWADGVMLNAGAYSHTSYAIRDAIAAVDVPVVEVHLSNIHARESFRSRSVLSEVCMGQICGFGWYSYVLALNAITNHLDEESERHSSP